MPARRSLPHGLRAAAGLAGPAAFTAAWLVAGTREPGYAVANEHISGLAAPDARSKMLMTAGFAALGLSTVVFARELDERLGGRGEAGPGPLLLGLTGVATLAAAVFRRDRRSNFPLPGEGPTRQSWSNDVHDLSAVAGGVAGTFATLALARRFDGDPVWADLRRPALAAATTGGGFATIFASDVVRPGSGILQRASVTIPLVFMGRVALRMLRTPPDQDSPGRSTSSRVRSTSRAIAATSSSIES
jgi:hypothetical protein